MAFSQNNSAATSALKPEGRYETIITSVDEKTYNSGSTSLSFRLTIRNDIPEQKYGNACLFYQIWKAKEPTKEDLAVKANKQYTITEAEKKSYLAQGYDIIGDNGAVEHSPQATVPYAEYEKAQAEIAKLRDELAQVRAAKTKKGEA